MRAARAGRCRGSVTAETAVALPGIVILVTGLLALPLAVGAQARCNDAAREAARAVARGDDPTTAARAVDAASQVTVTRADGLVAVAVSVPARLPVLGSVELHGRAVTADELTTGVP